MPRTNISGRLQDVATLCTELQDGLHDGSIPDAASRDDDCEVLAAQEAAFNTLYRYKARCFEVMLPGDRDDRDLGPSQEQRR